VARGVLCLRLATPAVFGLARADLGDALLDRNLELCRRLRGVVEVRHRDARQLAANRALDRR